MAAETYGVTPADVEPYVPELGPLNEAGGLVTKEAVEAFIGRAGSWVRARVGDIPAESKARDLAATAVVLGAASWTLAAAYPNRVEPNDSDLVSTLWDQFQQALDELLETLGIEEEAPPPPEPGAIVDAGGIDFGFPLPLFRRDQPF